MIETMSQYIVFKLNKIPEKTCTITLTLRMWISQTSSLPSHLCVLRLFALQIKRKKNKIEEKTMTLEAKTFPLKPGAFMKCVTFTTLNLLSPVENWALALSTSWTTPRHSHPYVVIVLDIVIHEWSTHGMIWSTINISTVRAFAVCLLIQLKRCIRANIFDVFCARGWEEAKMG